MPAPGLPRSLPAPPSNAWDASAARRSHASTSPASSPRPSGTCSPATNPSLRQAPRSLWPHRRPILRCATGASSHQTWSSREDAIESCVKLASNSPAADHDEHPDPALDTTGPFIERGARRRKAPGPPDEADTPADTGGGHFDERLRLTESVGSRSKQLARSPPLARPRLPLFRERRSLASGCSTPRAGVAATRAL